MKPLKFKVCGCGKVWEHFPKDAKLHSDAALPGVYFNCDCKSTLVVPLAQVAFEPTDKDQPISR